MWFWKIKFCSKHKKNDLNIEVNQEKNVKEEKNLYQNLNQQTKLKPD